VQYELEHYGDVIQGKFMDNYRTLTNKTMMGLAWVRAHCAHAQYVLKTDDDAFNVPQRYVDYLLTLRGGGVTKFVGLIILLHLHFIKCLTYETPRQLRGGDMVR